MITEDELFKDLTTFQIELVVSITVGVAFIFALFGGWMNRTFGRRIAIIVSSFFFGLGAIMLAVAHTFIELLVGRAVLGVGLGIASMSVPIYLSECAPKKSRGAIITINNLSLTGGQFLSAFVCAILSDVPFGWRYMLGIAAIPAILQFFGFIFLLPESPRYLMEKGRDDEAREGWVLTGIYLELSRRLYSKSCSKFFSKYVMMRISTRKWNLCRKEYYRMPMKTLLHSSRFAKRPKFQSELKFRIRMVVTP